jgi:hypothetical protein
MSLDTVDNVDTDDSPGLNIWADLKLSLTSLTDAIVKQQRTLQSRLGVQPRYTPLPGSCQIPASGSNYIDFGTPADGRAWTVRQLVSALQGGEATATNTGVACWYVGVLDGLVTNTSQWRHKQAALPEINNFSGDYITVRAREHLYVVYTAATPNATMVSVAVIHDRPMYDRVPTVSD